MSEAPVPVTIAEDAFTCAPIGMAVVGLSGVLLHVNDALCRITGYSAGQLCGRSFRA